MTPMSPRWRSSRVLAALIISGSLLASSVATSLGAVANLGFGGGWDTTNSDVTGATPDTVSPGKIAGFYLWAQNKDTANLSTFFLGATTDATPIGAFWSHSPSGPWTACDTSQVLLCTFGPLNSGGKVFVEAAFRVQASTAHTNCLTDPNRKTEPAIKDGVDPTGASWACVDFQWYSGSGYVPGKNRSRGDAYHWFDAVNTDTGVDSAAQFPFCDLSAAVPNCDSGLLSLTDTQNLTKGNPQWTSVLVPNANGLYNSGHGTTGIGVADNVSFDCNAVTGLSECSTTFLSQFSSVDVNSGLEFPDSWVKVDIGVYGVAASKIHNVFHFYQDGNGDWQVETLSKCSDANGPATTSSAACFWVVSLKGNSSQVTIWTHHNGKFNMG